MKTSDLVKIPKKEIVVFFLLDTSFKMKGTKISILNHTVEECLGILNLEIQRYNVNLKIAILDFNANWITKAGPVDSQDFNYEYLSAEGKTNLNLTLSELNSKLSRNEYLKTSGAFLPIFIFITDGKLTENIDDTLNQLNNNPYFCKGTKVGISLGLDTDFSIISKIVGTPEAIVSEENLEIFRKMIRLVDVSADLLPSLPNESIENSEFLIDNNSRTIKDDLDTGSDNFYDSEEWDDWDNDSWDDSDFSESSETSIDKETTGLEEILSKIEIQDKEDFERINEATTTYQTSFAEEGQDYETSFINETENLDEYASYLGDDINDWNDDDWFDIDNLNETDLNLNKLKAEDSEKDLESITIQKSKPLTNNNLSSQNKITDNIVDDWDEFNLPDDWNDTDSENTPKDLITKTTETKKNSNNLGITMRTDKSNPFDKVQFSALAPKNIDKGSYAIINITMYQESSRSIIDKMIKEYDEPIKETPSGMFKIKEDTKVRVILTSPDLEITDNQETHLWSGGYLNFMFDVYVPDNYEKKQILFKADIYVDDIPLTKLKFLVKIKAEEEQQPTITREDILSAFISYASQDRHRVAAIVQGMQKIRPDLDIFFDVESLRSGEDWERALHREINNRDILYLCWSRNARSSKWVDFEWRYALSQKGIDGIEPIPIETPELCPPPEELCQKHFNDKLIYLIDSTKPKEKSNGRFLKNLMKRFKS